jgi:hypothetical protein
MNASHQQGNLLASQRSTTKQQQVRLSGYNVTTSTVGLAMNKEQKTAPLYPDDIDDADKNESSTFWGSMVGFCQISRKDTYFESTGYYILH